MLSAHCVVDIMVPYQGSGVSFAQAWLVFRMLAVIVHMQELLQLAQELCTYTRRVKHQRKFLRWAFSQHPSFPLTSSKSQQDAVHVWNQVLLTAQRMHTSFRETSACRIWLTRSCCTSIIWSIGRTPTSATLSACMSPRRWRNWSALWQRPMRRVRVLSLVTLAAKPNVGVSDEAHMKLWPRLS